MYLEEQENSRAGERQPMRAIYYETAMAVVIAKTLPIYIYHKTRTAALEHPGAQALRLTRQQDDVTQQSKRQPKFTSNPPLPTTHHHQKASTTNHHKNHNHTKNSKPSTRTINVSPASTTENSAFLPPCTSSTLLPPRAPRPSSRSTARLLLLLRQ